MNIFSNRGGALSRIPPVTRNLLLANIIMWLAVMILSHLGGSLGSFGRNLTSLLGLHYVGAAKFNPIQLVTYMFMHDPTNPTHILFNMFTLWMFGRMLEPVWGQARFLLFYMVCGVGAALVQEGVWALTWQADFVGLLAKANGFTTDYMQQILSTSLAHHEAAAEEAVQNYLGSMITIGASGAIFGVLLGFAFVFPNRPLYFFFIPVPIKAKWMVLGYAAVEFFVGISGHGGPVAHFAHLGGMLFGLILLLYWKKKGTLGPRYF